MSRYIDADEFGRCLQNYRPYVDSGRFNAIQTEVNQVLDCIEYEIDDAPSIDIVFCENCRKSHIDGKTTHHLWCTEWGRSTDTFGYCERREREGE